MGVPRDVLEPSLRKLYDWLDNFNKQFTATGPLTFSGSPDYLYEDTVSGVDIVVRAWLFDGPKIGFIQLDVIGTSSSQIDETIDPLPLLPDLGEVASQSLFLNVMEYTEGAPVTSASSAGALIINRAGQMRLYINNAAAMTAGSSDCRFFKLL